MKKILFGAVAAMIALAACETIPPLDNHAEVQPEAVLSATDSVVFTASIGPQSKTYLEYNNYSYKTLWAEGDQILIWDADCLYEEEPQSYEYCTIKTGAGTSTAQFVTTLQADNYVALYSWRDDYPEDGLPVIHLPATQYLKTRDNGWNLDSYCYPMVAVSDGQNFEFQNICSILKVSITGNGELLETVTVSAANGEPMAGKAVVYANENDCCLEFPGEKEEDGVISWVDYKCGVPLSGDPVDCYIVVPAQYYSQGLSFKILTDRGSMEVSTGELTTERSRYYDISIDFEPSTISDLLGTYTATGENYWNGPCQWKITLYEDAVDGHKVWFDNLFQVDDWAFSDTRYYGIVSNDMQTIRIPFGQTSEYVYSNGKPLTLLGFDGVESGFDTGAVDAQVIIEGANITIDFGDEYGFWAWIEDAGNLNILNPGIVAVKD